MDTKPVVVSCELHWPFLNKQNDMSGKYQVDIGKLSSKAVDALSVMGIAVRNKGDDRGNYVTVKSINPIQPAFGGIDAVESSLIGNGTKANAAIKPYHWDFKGKQGTSPSLAKLLVTEVAVYDKDGGGDDALNMDDVI
tara:strand:+ start:8249 stop:8662 length:414 start_codon:yes stop_codon:yes gene_type:complete